MDKISVDHEQRRFLPKKQQGHLALGGRFGWFVWRRERPATPPPRKKIKKNTTQHSSKSEPRNRIPKSFLFLFVSFTPFPHPSLLLFLFFLPLSFFTTINTRCLASNHKINNGKTKRRKKPEKREICYWLLFLLKRNCFLHGQSCMFLVG